MTKQEEIREGVARWLFTFVHERENMKLGWEQTKGYYLMEADLLLGRLHSQDVVILSPTNIGEPPLIRNHRHYVAVEPLIKDLS